MPKRQKPYDIEDVRICLLQEIRNKFENILKEQRRDNIEMQQSSSVLEDSEAIPLSTHKNFDIAVVYGHNTKAKTKAISDLTAD
jgi:hypothetical protein